MQKDLHYCTKLWGTLLLFALCSFSAFGQEKALFKNGKKQGVVVLKLRPEAVQKVALQRSLSLNGHLHTGLKALDAAGQSVGAVSMERIFPYNPKTEAKHRKHGLDRWYQVKIDANADVSEAVKTLGKAEGVSLAEPVLKKALIDEFKAEASALAKSSPLKSKAASVPNDPLFLNQWHYDNRGQSGGTKGADMNLLKAWEVTAGSPKVIVSIHDEGVDTEHEDLKANLWINQAELNGKPGVDDDGNGLIDDIHGYDFSRRSGLINPGQHGTHVAGTVAAVNNNGIGVSGVAGGTGNGDGARIMSVPFNFDSDQSQSENMAATYVYAADNGAVISQNSWGYTSAGEYEEVILDAIRYFVAEAGDYFGSPMKGGIVIFAAGNTGSEGNFYPGYMDEVVAVSALDHNNRKPNYSTFGSWVDISAPGGSSSAPVISTFPNNQYNGISGTSMACPHVSGVAALILSQYGGAEMTPAKLRNRLLKGVKPLISFNDTYAGKLGSGSLDAYSALAENRGISPNPVTDLALQKTSDKFIELKWTVPVDEDDQDPFEYILYYDTKPINEATAQRVTIRNTKLAGQEMNYQLKGLLPETVYYLALKVADRWEHYSPISASISATTETAPVFTVNPNAFSLTIDTRQSTTVSTLFNVANTGGGSIKWVSSVRHNSMEAAQKAMEELKKKSVSSSAASISTLSVTEAMAGPKVVLPLSSGFPTEEISYVGKGGLYLELDKPDHPQSAATLFQVPYSMSKGLNLTHIRTQLRFLDTDQSVVVEIYKNGPLPDPKNLLYAQSYNISWYGANQERSLALDEKQYFKAGERFWVVIQTPGSPGGGVLGLSRYLPEALPAKGTFQYSPNYGADWANINDAGLDGWGWTVGAQSREPYLGNVITLNPVSGDLKQGDSRAIDLKADGAKLVNGNYDYTVVLNDGINPDHRLPLKLEVKGQVPDLNSIDLADIGRGFLHQDHQGYVRIENMGYGSFNVAESTSSDPRFSVTPVKVIPARSEIDLEITYRPTDLKGITTQITLSDSEGRTHSFRVFAGAEDPARLVITPSTDAFNIKEGESLSRTFTIKNEGAFPLSYTIPMFSSAPVEGVDAALKSNYGYSYAIHSGADYRWEDISTTGTEISKHFIANAHKSLAIDLGFAFDFFGQPVNRLYLKENGLLTLDPTSSIRTSTPAIKNTQMPKGYIAILNGGANNPMKLDPAGKIRYQVDRDRLIIQYENVYVGSRFTSHTGRGTYQAIIYANGDMRFAYKDIESLDQDLKDAFIAFEAPGRSDAVAIQQHNFRGAEGLKNAVMIDVTHPGRNMIMAATNPDGMLMQGEERTVLLSLEASSSARLTEGLNTQHLAVYSNDPRNPVSSITLNATLAQGSAFLAVDTNPVDFGNVLEGIVETRTVRIANTGTKPVTINQATTDKPGFQIEEIFPLILNPDQILFLTVKTDPTATIGLAEALLNIEAEALETYVVPLKAAIQGAPAIGVDQSALSSLLASGQKEQRSFRIDNTAGKAPLLVNPKAAAWLSIVDESNNELTNYGWIDNNEAGGPVFEWIDILNTGTRFDYNTWQQEPFVPVELPFNFPYYGQEYKTIHVGYPFGLLSFIEGDRTNVIGPKIPDPNGPNNFLAPGNTSLFSLSELGIDTAGVFYKVYPDKAVFSFENCSIVEGYTYVPVSFQAILYPNGRVRYQYKLREDNIVRDGLSQLVIGAENQDGTKGIEIANRIEYIRNGLAVDIFPGQTLEIPAGQSKSFTLEFDASNLSAGDYATRLILQNASPGKEGLEIPVSLQVTGVVNLMSSTESVDFGRVIKNDGDPVTQIRYKEFLLTNTGSTAAQFNSAAFSEAEGLSLEVFVEHARWVAIDTLGGFEVKAWQDQKLRVALDSWKAQAFNLTLSLSGAADSFSIPVTATVEEPPVMRVSEQEIAVIANTRDEVLHRNFSIENNGLSDLNYTLDFEYDRGLGAEPEVLKHRPRTTELPLLLSGKGRQTKALTSTARTFSENEQVLEHDQATEPVAFMGGANGVLLATTFKAGPEGFNLAAIKSFIALSKVPKAKLWAVVFVGDIKKEQVLYFEEFDIDRGTISRDGALETLHFAEAQKIYPNETFHVVIDYSDDFSYPQGFTYLPESLLNTFWVWYNGAWEDVTQLGLDEFDGMALMMKAVQTDKTEIGWASSTAELSGVLPPGSQTQIPLTFNPAEAPNALNRAQITVRGNDPHNTEDALALSLLINQAPVFVQYPAGKLVKVNEGASQTFSVKAEDKEGNALSLTVKDAPEWLTMNEAELQTLSFTAKPDYTAAGIHPFTITARDEYDQAASLEMMIEVADVNQAPTATEVTPREVQLAIGKTKEFILNDWFTDPDGDILHYNVSPRLPTTAVNASVTNGKLIITGLIESQVQLQVTAEDDKGGLVMSIVRVIVQPNQAPVFTQVPTNNELLVQEGKSATADLLAEDADGDPIFFELTNTPAWLSITKNETGVSLTARPGYQTVGNYPVTVTANDGQGNITSATVTVKVSLGNQAPTATEVIPKEVQLGVGKTKEFILNDWFTDPDGDILHYNVSPRLPTTAVNASVTNGKLIITGLIESQVQLQVTAEDDKGGLVMSIVRVIVQPNQAPVFTKLPANNTLTVQEAETVSTDLLAEDAEGDPIFYALANAPAWLSMMKENDGMRLTAAPDYGTAGSHTAILTANDGQGHETSATLTIIVSLGHKPDETGSVLMSVAGLTVYPNPIVDQVTVEYRVKNPGRATLHLFDASGKLVTVLVDGYHTAEIHKLSLDLSGLQSGIYFLLLDAEGQPMAEAKLIKQ